MNLKIGWIKSSGTGWSGRGGVLIMSSKAGISSSSGIFGPLFFVILAAQRKEETVESILKGFIPYLRTGEIF